MSPKNQPKSTHWHQKYLVTIKKTSHEKHQPQKKNPAPTNGAKTKHLIHVFFVVCVGILTKSEPPKKIRYNHKMGTPKPVNKLGV